MWTLTMGLAVSALTITLLTVRFRRGGPDAGLGSMSQHWIAEHRGGRY